MRYLRVSSSCGSSQHSFELGIGSSKVQAKDRRQRYSFLDGRIEYSSTTLQVRDVCVTRAHPKFLATLVGTQIKTYSERDARGIVQV